MEQRKRVKRRKHRRRRKVKRVLRILLLLIYLILIVRFLGLLWNLVWESSSTDKYNSEDTTFIVQDEMPDTSGDKEVNEAENQGQEWKESSSDEEDSLQEESSKQENVQKEIIPPNQNISWNLILANKWNPIPDKYEVNLVEVVPGGAKVDERIYGPLMEMLADATAENGNILPMVNYGYRTWEEQQALYDNKIAEYRSMGYAEKEAVKEAENWVAAPGTSEHQLGLAVDIKGNTYDVFTWLQKNSYKYGFIFRYSGDKADITGVAEEIWHYRYVGVEAAIIIYEQGICLEEYLERYP